MRHSSTHTARKVVKHLHSSLWDALARKAINKMPKYQLAQESKQMFEDTVTLNNNPTPLPRGQKMHTPPQTQRTAKETRLIGSTPIRPEELPEEYEAPVGRRRRAHTVIRASSTRGLTQELLFMGKRKKKQVVRLNTIDQPSEEQVELEDRLRDEIDKKTMKRQQLEQKQKARKARTQYRSMNEQKKYEQVKQSGFAYDYDGSLLDLQPSPSNKEPKKKSKSVEKAPYMSSASKPHTILSSRMQRNFTQTKRIEDKTVVQAEMEPQAEENQEDPEAEPRRKQVENGMRSVLHMWTSRGTLQAGVRLTDANDHKRIEGKRFEKSDKKMMTLSEFKLSVCGVDKFQSAQSHVEKCKTSRQRVKTEPTQVEKHLVWKNRTKTREIRVAQASKAQKGRGRIDIINDLLYAEHFPSSRN